ncbi:hypothetical protein [Schaalia suimastitidis]|uniref:hypothetical protein n=1 Tax=Schaalia suimastitidis TaxID=121163 RepID=UPI000420ECEF|nr:hypothetical protein [Schaalia suimastitidis]
MANTQYKCPACSAPIEFNAAIGLMTCDYCGSRFDVAQVERFNAHRDDTAQAQSHTETLSHAQATVTPGVEPRPQASPGGNARTHMAPDAPVLQEGQARAQAPTASSIPERTFDAADGMEELICNSCGAEIVADPTTISTRCGFCNNTFVANQRITRKRVPDFLIPFSVDKAGMLRAFLDSTRGKFLLPKDFRDQHTLSEATGTYLPYWFHDGTVFGDVHMEANETRSWTEGNNDCTETTTYAIHRRIRSVYRGVPACGTTKLDRPRAQGVEPFDLAGSKEFGTAYLSGYAASSYDIAGEDTRNEAHQRVREAACHLAARSVTNHSAPRTVSANLAVEPSGMWYALLPVWLIVISYAGKHYPFAINGQTGEVVGEFPISVKRKRAVELGFFAVFAILSGIVSWLLSVAYFS